MRKAWSTEYWLKRWRDGDQAAFARLYERYRSLLRAAVLRGPLRAHVRRRELDLDDVVDGFLTGILQNKAAGFAYRGKDSFPAWLQTALAGYEIDLLRKQSRQRRGDGHVTPLSDHEGEDIAQGVSLASPSPEPTPRASARYVEALDRARRLLNDDEFMAWRLMKLEGFTSEEVGLVLRRTGSGVRGVVDRAVDKLLRGFGRDLPP